MIIGLENAPAAAAAAAGRGGGVAGFPAIKIKSKTSKQAAKYQTAGSKQIASCNKLAASIKSKHQAASCRQQHLLGIAAATAIATTAAG